MIGAGARITGLDGLRAIAVVAVLLFHADLPFALGGYLGVDLFFVISGFLITSLLVSEYERHGRIRLGDFFIRRAKRLLPASLLMVALTVIAASLFAPDALPRLRDDALASLAYITNWKFIFAGQSYFESMGREPLLLHLWSLAIEEQFYLLWAPLAFILFPLIQRRVISLLVFTLAAISVAWMAALASSGDVDTARLYFGTDTHGFGLLLGAALGLLWRPFAVKVPRGLSLFASSGGLLSLLGLTTAFVFFGEQSEWLYPWGFLAASLLSVFTIFGATIPGSILGKALDNSLMRWLGERSYGIYLWHWPIFMMTRPELDMQADPVSIFVLRIALTLILAALSFRFIEMPIRRATWATSTAWKKALAVVPSAAVCAIVSSIFIFTPSQAEPAKDVVESLQEAPPLKMVESEPLSKLENLEAQKERTLTAIGDSVLLGAKAVLQTAMPNAKIYAAVSKQAAMVVKELKALKSKGELTPVVLVHLGTNGYVTERQLRDILELLSEQESVIVVNTRVPRKWMRPNNALIERVLPEYPNAKLANWSSLSEHRPDYFVSDGVHLSAKGQKAFLAGIQSAISN